MDLVVTNRLGSRFDPRALRTIERIGPYNHVLKCAPLKELRVAEIGELTSRDALEILRGLKGLNIVGADVVEVAPQYDATTNTVQVGAQMLFEI